jgi:hypothetical protein
VFKLIGILALASILGGCASTVGGILNRPVAENSIGGAASTVSLAADRRTVIVVTDGVNKSKFCAEPPPDTATSLKTDLDTTLKGEAKSDQAQASGKAELSAKDKFETSVKVIAQRTVALDAFRTGVYALCQLHLNGALTDKDVKALFEKLLDVFAAAQTEQAKVVPR